MFRLSIFFSLITMLPSMVLSQQGDTSQYFENSGEIIIRFETPAPDVFMKLSNIISIDEITGDETIAYTCRDGLRQFLEFDLSFSVVKESVNPEDFVMLDQVEVGNFRSWDFYPTYEAYLEMMDQFADDYPQLCEAFSIGQSVQGRELMMLKISANVAVREPEPQFLYTGTMHGDELVGYILLLRLADYLLANYGTDPRVTHLLDNSEIWINPLANPDGTYRGGNHTVAASTRFNANNVDLNRNYPDPEDGPHPDGKAWQPETIAFMQLAEDNNFVMSANTHSGAEVINYPWDTWPQLPADNDWWVFVSREYADTVHQYASPNYLKGFNNGITNGYAWYSISGGRQDYMNYFHHCREVTLELSNVKKLAASQLNAHWEWNYRSLLNYYAQCTYGISGVITDVDSGLPIAAKVEIAGHDIDNSFVVADSATGFYRRMLEAGTYDITFSASGYAPQTISGLEVARYNDLKFDVQLSSGALKAGFVLSQNPIETGAAVDFYDASTGNPTYWLWEFEGAVPETSSQQNPVGIHYPDAGNFSAKLKVKNGSGDSSVLLMPVAVKVAPPFIMSNQEIEVINGIFYDAGGPSGNYSNNENLTMTFKPKYSGSKISADFLEFGVEAHSACSYDKLMVYDGEDISAPLLGYWCGTDLPGKIKATGPTGALTFHFVSDLNVTKSGWKALIQSEQSQNIILPKGWSAFAFNLQPEELHVETLFAPVSDNLLLLSGTDGYYQPDQNFNTLSSVRMREGYLIKMSEADSLTMNGFREPYLTIGLNVGWNLFPVLAGCAVSTGELNAFFQDEQLVIKEVAGTNVYWPSNQVFTLANLQPGKTYLIYVGSEQAFTFPDCN